MLSLSGNLFGKQSSSNDHHPLAKGFLSRLLIVIIMHVYQQSPTSASSINQSDSLSSELIWWVRSNGGYVSDKIEIRRADHHDSNSPRGLFATSDIGIGEDIAIIPMDLILKSPKAVREDAPEHNPEDWIAVYCGCISDTIRAMTADQDEITPYGRYLLSQPRNYTVGFWSSIGRDLFVEMTGYVLPPNSIGKFIDIDQCGLDLNDDMNVQAAMLVSSRADDIYMVPIYDMMNHHNGRANIKLKNDPFKDPIIEDTGYVLVSHSKINSGEELFISYNQCDWCYGWIDWFGTPEIFLYFGFVEMYPQRWLFDLARVKVDLILEGNSGEEKKKNNSHQSVVVKFLVPPSEKGMKMLQKEIVRMDEYSAMYRNSTCEDLRVPLKEWISLWSYYDALYAALTSIIKSNESLVDDVWKMDDHWWIQDDLVINDDHRVRPSLQDEL